jgi:hypothetical protein
MSTSKQKRCRHGQRGAAIAEFAITLPIFLALVLGVIEYGHYFYVSVSANNAAREGARQCTLVSLGACGKCDPTAAVDYMGKLGLKSNTTARATCAVEGGAYMYTVGVRVDFPSLTSYPIILSVLPQSPKIVGNIVAGASAVMRGQ